MVKKQINHPFLFVNMQTPWNHVRIDPYKMATNRPLYLFNV